MPMRIGLVLYPLFIIAVASKQSGVVSKFRRAKAFSPETSRRPRSLGVNDPRLVQDELRRGVLVAVGDGRCYLDRNALRRARRRIALVAALVGAIAVGAGVAIALIMRQ